MPPKARLSKKQLKAMLAAEEAGAGEGSPVSTGDDAEDGETIESTTTTTSSSNAASAAGGDEGRKSSSSSSTTTTTSSSSYKANAADDGASTITDASSVVGAGGGSVASSEGFSLEAMRSFKNKGASGAGDGSSVATQDAAEIEDMGGEAEHRKMMKLALEKVNVTTSTYQDKIHPNARDIRIMNLSVILAGKVLLSETDLQLSWGQRYAIIGPNGCGKSILMTLLGKRMLPVPTNMDSFHLVSEVDPSELTAIECVLAVDQERKRLEATAAEIEELITGEDNPEQEELNTRLCEVYERLDEMGAATAEAKASQILFGLGFDSAMQNKKCKDFSGGWRMRVALARALFTSPDFLILDEPTNHLDMEAVVWLEKHLATFNKILFLCSHSQDFMNNVCTNIIRVHKKKLELFGGNYDQYCETKLELEKAQTQKYEWEQDQISHMKDFIARFGHGTRKMAMQAQSREKVLKKMEESGLTEKVEFDKSMRMRFPDPGKLPPPVLMLANVSFGYPGCPLLYQNVDFGVDLDSRIALVGPNGAGKTTLLKLMCGDLVPTQGGIRPHPHLRFARYTQHFVDALDLSATPLDYFGRILKDMPVNDLRTKLGRFGISGDFQSQVMAELSDGIKSRVVFALLATKNPHILMLDEPTNHLDIETIDALADAIKVFEGGVVLVSHDMRLIDQVVDGERGAIYECDHKKVTKFQGDILGYKSILAKKIDAAAEKFERDRKARQAK